MISVGMNDCSERLCCDLCRIFHSCCSWQESNLFWASEEKSRNFTAASNSNNWPCRSCFSVFHISSYQTEHPFHIVWCPWFELNLLVTMLGIIAVSFRVSADVWHVFIEEFITLFRSFKLNAYSNSVNLDITHCSITGKLKRCIF